MKTQNSKNQMLEWGIRAEAADYDLPSHLRVTASNEAATNLPVEIAMLLPTQSRNRKVIDNVSLASLPASAALGLFLIDPFLHLETIVDRLRRHNVRWICNFPSAGQYDPAFESYLDDVDLGLATEMQRLKLLKEHGLQTLAMLSQAKHAAAILETEPDAIAYVPTVATFLDGVPTLSKRAQQERHLELELRKLGWQKPLLKYRDTSDPTDPDVTALLRPTKS